MRRRPIARLFRAIPASVPIVSLLVHSLTGQPTNATMALYGEAAAPLTAAFHTLSAAEVLDLHPGYIDLGTLVTNKPVDSAPLVVHNVSDRTLSLSAQVKNLPGLHVVLEPSRLEPGESASLVIYGRPGKPGQVQGYVRLTAFEGYMEVEIPVTGRIKVPPMEACDSAQTGVSLGDDVEALPLCQLTDEQHLQEPVEELLPAEPDEAENAAGEAGDASDEPVPPPEAEPAVPVIEPFVPPAPGEVPIVEPFDRLPADGPAPIVEVIAQQPASTHDEPFTTAPEEIEEVPGKDRAAPEDEGSRKDSDAELEDVEPDLDVSPSEVAEPG